MRNAGKFMLFGIMIVGNRVMMTSLNGQKQNDQNQPQCGKLPFDMVTM